jgi:hypothetical protein
VVSSSASHRVFSSSARAIPSDLVGKPDRIPSLGHRHQIADALILITPDQQLTQEFGIHADASRSTQPMMQRHRWPGDSVSVI